METILVVEDKESMAAMLKETLEAEGYTVIAARDAMKGIKYLKDGKIDLVLTDLKLPGKSGIDVLKASKEENHLIPVIVMTAFGSFTSVPNTSRTFWAQFPLPPTPTCPWCRSFSRRSCAC